ncbi:MAG: hypothetical protein SNJ71_01260, partial [Bacteroidales bacterium]
MALEPDKEPRLLYYLAITLFILIAIPKEPYNNLIFFFLVIAIIILKLYACNKKNTILYVFSTISIILITFFLVIFNPINILPKQHLILTNTLTKYGFNYNVYMLLFILTTAIITITFALNMLKSTGIIILTSCSTIAIAIYFYANSIFTNQQVLYFLQNNITVISIIMAGFVASTPFILKQDDTVSKNKAVFGYSGHNKKYVVKFGNLEWDDRDFPRGWSITGETGSGKTEAAFKAIFVQLCLNRPNWGGVLVD